MTNWRIKLANDNKPDVTIQPAAKDQPSVRSSPLESVSITPSHVVEGHVGPDGSLVVNTSVPMVEKVSGSGTKEDPLHSDGMQPANVQTVVVTTAQATNNPAISAEQAAQEQQAKNAQSAQEQHEKLEQMAKDQGPTSDAKEGDVRVLEGTDVTYHVGNTDEASPG